MKLSDISVSIECEIIAKNDETKFYFDKDGFVVSFLFPIHADVGLLYDKIPNYIITQRIENSKLILTDVCFQLYSIELYENKFKKAMEDFKNIVCLSCDNELKKDVLVEAFLRIIDISTNSYDQAYAYLNREKYRDRDLTFRQYCGLETCQKK